MSIKDALPDFYFGLWSECPDDVPIAWGARAIADPGVGFSLLGDRQTWAGPANLREVFKIALDRALPIANLNCKRLREGWDPIKELAVDGSPDEFRHFFFKRLREMREEFGSDEAVAKFLSEKNRQFLWRSRGPDLSEDQVLSALGDVALLQRLLKREHQLRHCYYEEIEEQEERWQRNPPSPPPPPPRCAAEDACNYFEEDEEVCEQEFTRLGNNRYRGCTFEDDYWRCDNCGYSHSVHWEDHPDAIKEPDTPYLDAFGNFFAQRQMMHADKSETFEVFNDGHMVIKANTNASHGYIYLVAYPIHVADTSELKWSGKEPPPKVGDRIMAMRDIGEATVVSHVAMHGYLFMNVLAANPPDWVMGNIERHKSSGLLEIAGAEMEEL